MFAFSGAVTAEKFGATTAWSKPYAGAESMKVIDFTGDGQDELFVQNTSDVTVYDGSGAVMWNFRIAARRPHSATWMATVWKISLSTMLAQACLWM